MLLQSLFLSMLDPRGRCNRRGLLLAAVTMLTIEAVALLGLWYAGLGLDTPVAMAIKAGVIYLAIAATIQRLHDLGQSAWNLVWAALALIAWSVLLGLAVLMTIPAGQAGPGDLEQAIVFTGLAMPMLSMLLWLHFAPGESGANRFGPEPDWLGFARVSTASSAVPADAAPMAA